MPCRQEGAGGEVPLRALQPGGRGRRLHGPLPRRLAGHAVRGGLGGGRGGRGQDEQEVGDIALAKAVERIYIFCCAKYVDSDFLF